MQKYLLLRRTALIFTAAFLLAAADVAEGQEDAPKPSLRIAADEVEFTGPVHVKSKSNIKDIGEGSVQIRDSGLKTAVLVGTSTNGNAGPGQRFHVIEGDGFGVHSESDTGGVFVSSNLARVGINDASGNFNSELHVGGSGDFDASSINAAYAGNAGPAMKLDATHHNTIVFGKNSDKLKYSIGRGKVTDRTMTFAVPNIAAYDNAGKPPLMIYQSPDKVLAAVTADSGNMYVAGNLGVGAEAAAGSKVHVAGQIRMERTTDSKTQANGAAFYYPASGKTPAMSFRTGQPSKATAVDTRLYLAGDKASIKVGVNTRAPKVALDVRGHMYMESTNANGEAGFYFPTSGSGKKPGFYIRGTDTPKNDDVPQTRFYIHPNGATGINTNDPNHGLCIHARGDTKDGEHLSIPKGSLHVKDGVYDMDGVHKLTLDDVNIFKNLAVETGVTVGHDKAHEGQNAYMGISGSKRPTLKLSQQLEKDVHVVLQTGTNEWKFKSTKTDLFLTSSKVSQTPFRFTKTGNMIAGVEPAKFGLQVESVDGAEKTDPRNDAFVRGNIHIRYGILQKSIYMGQPIVWSLNPQLFSNLKDVGVGGKLAVGTDKEKPTKFYVEQGRSVDVGDAGFLFATGNQGTLSFNEHVVTNNGATEKKLHDKKKFAAAMRLGTNGVVDFEGTPSAGVLTMNKLMSFNAPSRTASFGQYADFGMDGAGQKFPLRVKGGSSASTAAIGFGHVATYEGLLGSTEDIVYLANRDEKHYLAFQHKDGHLGIGTQTATEELTLRGDKADAHVHLTSTKSAAVAQVTMKEGGSMQLSASQSDQSSGKFEAKDFTGLEFSNAGGSAETIFDRGNAPAGLKAGESFDAPHVEFRTGKVGLSVSSPEHHLHIGGDHWSQGQLILKKGFAQAPSAEMDMLEMIQLAEGATERHEAGINVVDAVASLARLVRRNKKRLLKQANDIKRMEGMLAQVSQ